MRLFVLAHKRLRRGAWRCLESFRSFFKKKGKKSGGKETQKKYGDRTRKKKLIKETNVCTYVSMSSMYIVTREGRDPIYISYVSTIKVEKCEKSGSKNNRVCVSMGRGVELIFS